MNFTENASGFLINYFIKNKDEDKYVEVTFYFVAI